MYKFENVKVDSVTVFQAFLTTLCKVQNVTKDMVIMLF
jgi:hypothetical protein